MRKKEDSYISVYLFNDTSKKDLTYFNTKYPFKYKKDKISIILLVLLILSFIPIIWVSYFTVVVGALAAGLFFYRRRFLQKRNITYLSFLEANIIRQGKEYNAEAINAVYPLYMSYDNANREFVLRYLDKEFLVCDYSQIEGYRILIDRFEYKNNRLPDVCDKTAKSYMIEISFKNGKKLELGLANVNRSIKLHNSVRFLQYANTKTINKIAISLDRIMKNNKI